MANAFLDLTGTPALIATGSNDLRIGCSGTGTTKLFSGGVSLGFVYSSGASDFQFFTDSADGADNKSMSFCGGGAIGSTRGGTLQLYGNEYSGTPGYTYVSSGAIAASILNLDGRGDGSPPIRLRTPATAGGSLLTRWGVGNDGDLDQDGTNGGSIVLTKASTCVVPGTSATGLTAAGTIITDALDLTAVFNNVTTVAASTGVQLWDAPLHSMIAVRNAGANALNVWPEAAGSTINGGSAGAAVAVATGTLNLFWRTGATAWIAVEFTVAAA